MDFVVLPPALFRSSQNPKNSLAGTVSYRSLSSLEGEEVAKNALREYRLLYECHDFRF